MAFQRCPMEARSSNEEATGLNYCRWSNNEGLWIDNECVYNCTRFCTDARILFSDYSIFAACLDPDDYYPELNPPDMDMALEPDVEKESIGNTTVRLVDKCMTDYCRFASDSNLGGCPYRTLTEPNQIGISGSSNSTPSMPNALFNFSYDSGACNGTRPVNSDIGGPGVSPLAPHAKAS